MHGLHEISENSMSNSGDPNSKALPNCIQEEITCLIVEALTALRMTVTHVNLLRKC